MTAMPPNEDRRARVGTPGHGGIDYDSSNSAANVVAFRQRRNRRVSRDRVIFFAIRAGSLKQAVMSAYHHGLIDARAVADVFAKYRLRQD